MIREDEEDDTCISQGFLGSGIFGSQIADGIQGRLRYSLIRATSRQPCEEGRASQIQQQCLQ